MAIFLAAFPMSGAWRWRGVLTSANGQPAIGFYAWDEDAQAYLPFALNVLTLRGNQVTDVVAFAVRAIDAEEPEAYHRWVDQPADAARLQSTFARFGLPETL
jgi:RNA polymerase sigma-70 factor (ECF subfamily)